MSSLDLLEASYVDPGREKAERPTTGYFENVSAAFTSTRDNFNSESEARLTNKYFQPSLDRYQELTGKDMREELQDRITEAQKINLGLSPRDLAGTGQETNDQIEKRILSEYINELKTKDPNMFGSLVTYDEAKEQGKKEALESARVADEVYRYSSGSLGRIGSFVGGLAGAMTDPLNIASMPLGAGVSRSILKTALIEAGINVGVEALIQPQVQAWQQELGNEYGFDEITTNLLFAAGGGALLGAGPKAAVRSLEVSRVKTSQMLTSLRSKLDEVETVPRAVKDAVERLERIAVVKESDPFSQRAMDLFTRRHEENLNASIERIYGMQEPIRRGDIPVTAREFNSIETRITDDMSPQQKLKAEDLKRFQNEDAIQPIKEGDRIDDIDMEFERNQAAQAVKRTRKKQKGEIISPDDFQDVAIIGKTKSGKPNLKLDNKKLKGKINILNQFEPGQAALIRKTKDGYEAFPLVRDTFQERLMREDAELPVEGNALDEALSVRAVPEDVATQKEAYAQAVSPEARQAEVVEFERLLNDNPNLKILDEEGKAIDIRNVLKDVEQEEAGLEALKVCSLGG